MGTTFQQDKDFQNRVAEECIKQNPYIKDLEDLRIAMYGGMNTKQGNNYSGHLDEEDLLTLFENPKIKHQLKQNNSEKDYKRMFEEEQEGYYEVENVRRGKKVRKVGQIVRIEKKIVARAYVRDGKQVRGYNRSKRRIWTPADVRFLRVRKAQNKSVADIVREYNQKYKDNPRSRSSIKTKVYRS